MLVLRICWALSSRVVDRGQQRRSETCSGVADHPGPSFFKGLLVFNIVAVLGDCREVAIGVKAMVGDGFTEWWNDWQLQRWSFNVFPKVPFKEFVIQLCYIPCPILVLHTHLCFPYPASFLICTYQTALPLIPDLLRPLPRSQYLAAIDLTHLHLLTLCLPSYSISLSHVYLIIL
jgi:hypothetical protein